MITEINKQLISDQASYQAIVGKLKAGEDVVFIVRSTAGGSAAGPTIKGGTLP